jgi:hypothetical protein
VSRRGRALGIPLLAAAVLLPAVADAAAKRPATTKAALATGSSADGAARFRLEGRQLTVTASGGLGGSGVPQRLRLLVRCGESVAAPDETSAATLAVQGGRRVTATTRRTVLRVALSRDVAARANWCELRDLATGSALHEATLRLRRGTAPGCVRAGRERVAFRRGRALVTTLTETIEGQPLDRYRVCMRAGDRLEPLVAVGPALGAQSSLGELTSAGRWLAWRVSSRDRHDHAAVDVQLLDVERGGPVEPVRAGGFSGTTAYLPRVGQLLVTDAGTAVWTLVSRYDDPARPEWATLYAGDGDSEARELERVEPAALLTDVALSADGRTVTWRNGGVPRSAPLTR